MRTFNSPGGASMVIMFGVSPRSGEGNTGQNDGGMGAGLRSPFMRLVLPPRSAWGKAISMPP
jgi:hypothetical protein